MKKNISGKCNNDPKKNHELEVINEIRPVPELLWFQVGHVSLRAIFLAVVDSYDELDESEHGEDHDYGLEEESGLVDFANSEENPSNMIKRLKMVRVPERVCDEQDETDMFRK